VIVIAAGVALLVLDQMLADLRHGSHAPQAIGETAGNF
jgi:hypothetical protein